MADRDEGFLARWSRLKRAEQEQRPAAPAVEEGRAENASPVAAEPGPEPGAEAADPNLDLPPIESLDRYSDYTVFMRAGVAPELRKQALAKLWRSDPVLANLDGLLEYGEDYSLAFKQPRLVTTLYQVGKGMVDARDEPAVASSASPEASGVPEAASGASPPEAGSTNAADAKDEAGEASAAAAPVGQRDA